MGGQRIEPGTNGPLWVSCLDEGSRKHGERRPALWRARTRLCLVSGRLMEMERSADTKGGAETALRRAIRDRLAAEKQGARRMADLSLGQLTEDWIVDMMLDTRLEQTSREKYGYMARKHLVGCTLADLPPRRLTAGMVEDRLDEIARQSGPGAAKTVRSVWSKVMARGVRHEVVERNVVRDAEPRGSAPTLVRPDREHDRALTDEEVIKLLLHAYRTDRWKRDKDIADLCAFMLSTGVRLGEALAVRGADVDRLAAEVSINATIVRIAGVGLERKRPKTLVSDRVIPAHPRTMALIERRRTGAGPLFPPPLRGAWRDPSNVSHDISDLLAEVGLTWATSHSFRRTVITKLGDRGVPLRLMADLAGHGDPAMTARKYLGRRGASEVLRAAL